jgi:hypothetical protein
MNHKITQVFVPTSVSTSATTDALASQALAFYDGKLTTNLGATPSAAESYAVIGTGSTKYGSFKSGLIGKSNVLKITKTTPDTSVKQQITYLGFDEVNDSKTPSFSCDEEFVVTLKIDEYWSKGIYQPMIQDSVRVKTPCCADCAGGCDASDAYAVMDSISTKINANPLLSKYVTASVVSKGTPAAYKYILTLPDPGTSVGGVSTITYSGTSTANGNYNGVAVTGGTGSSATFNVVIAGGVVTSVTPVAAGTGYTIGDTLTIASGSVGSGGAITLVVTATTGPEGTLLNALKAYYPSATYGAITFSTDTDGDPDTDALNNSTFEILTPVLTNVADMPVYNGIAWESVLKTAASVTAAGVKLTGNALDEFGNACVPDAVPYVFNLVRFKVSVHEGPYNTQDFDIEDWCGPWTFTKTQDIKYPIGAGAAMAEMERHFFGNNLPATAEARRYWNPIYNNDSDEFLVVDKTTTYDMYEITYLEPSAVGFEKKSENTHSIVILAASGVTAAVTTALNNVLPTQFHV